MPINPTSVLKYEYPLSETIASSVQPNKSLADTTLLLQSSEISNALSSNSVLNVESTISVNESDSHRPKRSVSSISSSPIISTTMATAAAATTTTTIIQPTQIVLQSTHAKSQSNISEISNSKSFGLQKSHHNARANIDKSSNKANEKKRNDAIIGRINVLIHNISVISSADKDYLDNSDKEWTHSAQR